MNHKIIYLIMCVYSDLAFSSVVTTTDSNQNYQEYWKARSQTASEQKVDEVLGKWVPGYGWVPGVASLIGEPAKEVALLGQGLWGVKQGESGAYGQIGNVLGREAATRVVEKISPNINPANLSQLLIQVLTGTWVPRFNTRPSSTILRSVYSLINASGQFNDAYDEVMHKAYYQARRGVEVWGENTEQQIDAYLASNIFRGKRNQTRRLAILAGIKAVTVSLGYNAFLNWVSGKIREYLNRINSGYLQKSYYIQGNDAYNQKIDIIFEENPILFTLAKDTDRKLLIAAKLAEMENPHIFDALKIEEQKIEQESAQAQVVENQAVGLEQDKRSLPITTMATPKIAKKRVTRRK